jgi:hypothetical protein
MTSFDFARSMHEAVLKYGSLTEKQMAACERMAAKATSSHAAYEARVAAAAGVDSVALVAAFERNAKGFRHFFKNTAGMQITKAPAHGRNPGALYVKDIASSTFLGTIKDGKFIRSRECTAEQEATFLRVAADPYAAALKFGETGICAICSAELTNPESIKRGIGPVCAAKFGW